MNDRFKFRAWAKPHEPTKTEGYYVDDADYMVMTSDGKAQIEYYCDNGYDGYIDSFEQDEIIIEQCTGLKDKNGKLIYEGDIVEIIDRENSNTLDRTYPMLFNEKVAKFGYKHPDGHFFYHSNNDDYSYEVIGNIHENSYLLD